MNLRTSSQVHNFALKHSIVLAFYARNNESSIYAFEENDTKKEEKRLNVLYSICYTLQQWCPLQLVPKEA